MGRSVKNYVRNILLFVIFLLVWTGFVFGYSLSFTHSIVMWMRSHGIGVVDTPRSEYICIRYNDTIPPNFQIDKNYTVNNITWICGWKTTIEKVDYSVIIEAILTMLLYFTPLVVMYKRLL